jgi:hypothetical protein
MQNFCEKKATFLVVRPNGNIDQKIDSLIKEAPRHFSFIALSSREDFTHIEMSSRIYRALPPLVDYSDILYFACLGGAFRFDSVLEDLNFYISKGAFENLIIDENIALITPTDITCEQGISDFYGKFKKLTGKELEEKMKIPPLYEGAKVALARQAIEKTRSPKLSRHDEFFPYLGNVRNEIRYLLKDQNKSGLFIVSDNERYPENSIALVLHQNSLNISDVHVVLG